MNTNISNMNEWRKNRYKLFNDKINSFKDHEKFSWLRQYADETIHWNEMCGYLQIKAEDFIKRIEKMPLSYIEDWLNGKNQLEWKPKFAANS